MGRTFVYLDYHLMDDLAPDVVSDEFMSGLKESLGVKLRYALALTGRPVLEDPNDVCIESWREPDLFATRFHIRIQVGPLPSVDWLGGDYAW